MIFEYIYHKFRGYFLKFLLVFILVFYINSPMAYSSTIDINAYDLAVIEELRIKVPLEFKKAWIQSEKEVWEPWLSNKKGFLERQLFWNKEKEEALILVNWENKKLWKSISIQEVNDVQRKFEKNIYLFVQTKNF